MSVLTVRDGNVEIGGRPVLRGIDLEVRRGEAVAVLGANGSGKTTLIRAVTGLVPFGHGELRLFDTTLSSFRDWHRVGYAPQRPTATAGVPATVAEVVSSGRLSRRRRFTHDRQEDRTAVRDAIRAVDLDQRHDDPVAELSGGQQQRVLIARALASQPELLILDEPTAGLDQHSQTQLAATLHRLIDDATSVVLVLHEPGALAPLIDRAVVLRDGRVGYDGPLVAELTPAPVTGHDAVHQPTDARIPINGAWPGARQP